MAIIAFWSNEEKETGQTMSMVALSTYMAIEHNYRILNVSTSFKDSTLEDSFFDLTKTENLVKTLSNNQTQVGLESGIEGLVKIINSNKTSNNIVSNYTKVAFKDRLDILCAPKTRDHEDYRRTASLYPSVLQVANRAYDLVFIDISKRMPQEQVKQVLELADVIIINLTQRLKIIDNFIMLKEKSQFFKSNKILLNFGRYDSFSKYNVKNTTRYMKEKKDVHVTPYNTLFFEACSEGKVREFFLRLRKIEDPEDRNTNFIEEISRTAKDLIFKMQELQIKL